MNCNFTSCIYNKNFVCTLNKIYINEWGMCEECIIVSIPEPDLTVLKEKQLQDMNGRCSYSLFFNKKKRQKNVR